MFLAGIHPVIGRWSVGLLREGPFLMFSAFAMAVFMRAFRTGSAWDAALCGLLLGAAVMTRHEAVELMLLGAVALSPWKTRDATNGKSLFARWRQPLFLLLGLVSAVALILVLTGIPLSFLMHQYLLKLDKIRLR